MRQQVSPSTKSVLPDQGIPDLGGNCERPFTIMVNNSGDFLYTTVYPNHGRETVLLLHGGPGFPGDLDAVAAMLKNNFQVITFHQRGTRQSPCHSHDYSMEAYISDVEAVRHHFKLSHFHLWGHSWGGLYAQIYTSRYPEHLLSLFLCCPGSGTSSQWQQTEREVMQLNRSKCSTWQWAWMGVNNLLGMLGSDSAYKRLFKQVMRNYNDGFVIHDDDSAVDFSNLKAEPINKTRPEIIRYPVLPRMEQPAFRITIVYGDQDIYQTSKDFVIQRYPTASLTILKHCGHIPWLHNPEAYRESMRSHFEAVNT